ncbi:MAG: hypothetical protein M0Q44_21015 [Methylobacter sp.]|jgi:hypothetical protein|nr:hypothetical protein [Methylobacter sp.]
MGDLIFRNYSADAEFIIEHGFKRILKKTEAKFVIRLTKLFFIRDYQPNPCRLEAPTFGIRVLFSWLPKVTALFKNQLSNLGICCIITHHLLTYN